MDANASMDAGPIPELLGYLHGQCAAHALFADAREIQSHGNNYEPQCDVADRCKIVFASGEERFLSIDGWKRARRTLLLNPVRRFGRPCPRWRSSGTRRVVRTHACFVYMTKADLLVWSQLGWATCSRQDMGSTMKRWRLSDLCTNLVSGWSFRQKRREPASIVEESVRCQTVASSWTLTCRSLWRRDSTTSTSTRKESRRKTPTSRKKRGRRQEWCACGALKWLSKDQGRPDVSGAASLLDRDWTPWRWRTCWWPTMWSKKQRKDQSSRQLCSRLRQWWQMFHSKIMVPFKGRSYGLGTWRRSSGRPNSKSFFSETQSLSRGMGDLLWMLLPRARLAQELGAWGRGGAGIKLFKGGVE